MSFCVLGVSVIDRPELRVLDWDGIKWISFVDCHSSMHAVLFFVCSLASQRLMTALPVQDPIGASRDTNIQ